MNYQEIISKRIFQLRKNKGITVQMLADVLGIKQPSASTYETGKTFPNSHNLIKLAEYFDVSIDYLVGRTDITEINKG